MKERLLVQELISFIKFDAEYSAAIVAGIRRIGKTTILKQIQEYFPDATYIDFANTTRALDSLDEFLKNPNGVLLLDEITYLDNYENICQDIYNVSSSDSGWKFKVIITGSSPAHLCKLAYTKLGGGRSRLFHLPIVTFIEYLYFTDRIKSYSEYDAVTIDDFKDYLSLKDLTPGLALSFDAQYFIDYYKINTDSNENSHVGRSISELKKDDLINIANLLAYQLAENSTYGVTMNPEIGVRAVSHEDRARMIAFLLDSRIANIGTILYAPEDGEISAQELINELKSSRNKTDLDKLFSKVSIAINSPLLYTRLGEDILKIANSDLRSILSNDSNNDLLVNMLEVYVRGALSQYGNPLLAFSSVKLNYPDVGEVDVCALDNSLMCEITAGKNKALDEVNVSRYYKSNPCIRICAT